jgi:AraC family transcriptional regulator
METRVARDDYRQRINRVLACMEGNLDALPSLDHLAGLAHYSPHHFHRVFTGMVGESLAAYARRLRLERAAMLLARTARPVTDIALGSAYDSHEAFTRAFKAHFDVSPSAYREAARRGLPLPKCPVPPPTPQGDIAMDAKIVFFPVTKVAYVRHVGPYAGCHAAWETLCGWAGPKGLLGPQTRVIGVCHDDPEVTPPEKIRYDACLAVGEGVTAEGPVGVMDIGGGDYAMALHEGPYSGLHQSYATLCGVELPKLSREPGYAPSFEIYVNDPATTPPKDLRTEIYIPLLPKA